MGLIFNWRKAAESLSIDPNSLPPVTAPTFEVGESSRVLVNNQGEYRESSGNLLQALGITKEDPVTFDGTAVPVPFEEPMSLMDDLTNQVS